MDYRLRHLSLVGHCVLAPLLSALAFGCSGKRQVLGVEPTNDRECGVTDEGFSDRLQVYQHPSAADSADQIFSRVVGAHQVQNPDFLRAMIAMYQQAGIDLSLTTEQLRAAEPTSFCGQTPQPLTGTFVQPYSVDAPFYHVVPSRGPRLALPLGMFQTFHVGTVQAPASVAAPSTAPTTSDGWGFGIVISGGSNRPGDPVATLGVKAADGSCVSNGTEQSTVVRVDANGFFPSGDRDVTFIDAGRLLATSTYGVGSGTTSHDFCATFVAPTSALGNLGTDLGITGAGFANLAALLREGEASDPTRPIPHALAGPTRAEHLFNAMVYPAANMDGSLRDTLWTGILPYGAHLQLDPALDLGSLGLSLPARRILEALQTYGFYVDGAGVRDMDVHSNTIAEELGDVDAAVSAVVSQNAWYLVPPAIRTH